MAHIHADRRRPRRGTRDRRDERLAHAPHGPEDARLARAHRAEPAHPPQPAAPHRQQRGGVRDGAGRRARRRAHRGVPWGPARGHTGPAVQTRGGEEHVRHGVLHASQHGVPAGAVEPRAPLHDGVPARQGRAAPVRARGQRGHRGRGGVVAQGQPWDHQVREGDRRARGERAGLRGGVLRARLQRTLRAALANGRSRVHRGDDAVLHEGAHRAGDAGGDLLPEPRGAGGDEGGRGGAERGRPARGRGRHAERAPHEHAGRHPRDPGGAAGGHRDHRARRRPRCRHRRRPLARGVNLPRGCEGQRWRAHHICALHWRRGARGSLRALVKSNRAVA
mmetsp:Transcript_544/g.1209  ORF Transcript_544/g.1209 Transcript_544/m.1209 type:complete len:335 (-) Transcript_544:85-1089(-)